MVTSRRPVAALLLATVLTIGAPAPKARADLFGADVAELAAILAELLVQGLTLFEQLNSLKSQVQYAEQNLRQLDPSSLRSLLDRFNTLKWSYHSVKGQAEAIGFTAQRVQQDFDRLFPGDKAKWRSVNHAQFDSYYTSWQAQISNSSAMAMSAQTQIDLLKRQNDGMIDILRQSQASDGALTQLQLINQSLAKIHDRLGTVIDVLATGLRVTSSLAATGANEKLMGRESKLRRIDGYTNRGRPPKILKKLP
jgi:P-type conjugative transfer protein TrbJ